MIGDLPPVVEAPVLEEGAYAFHDEAILGTRLNLILVANNFAAAQAAAIAARAEIDRLGRILNCRDPKSELSALNHSHEHRASAELFDVVSAAEYWRTVSSGAYSGRLGHVLNLWRNALHDPPPARLLADLAAQADAAHVELDSITRSIRRPEAVVFALDALAKGWIVDRAFAVARTAAEIGGALVDIGGDIRCGGAAPDSGGWRVGVADPQLPTDNAPLIASARMRDHAIATSGHGPRDLLIGARVYSPTVSPRDGWPVDYRRSATVIAASAADADALATALLVLPEDSAIELAQRHQAIARISDARQTITWTRLAHHAAAPAHFVPIDDSRTVAAHDSALWPDRWQALAMFTAPRRQLIRDPTFRSPYMAMWITDPANRPVRTLLLVGKREDWQKDNFIWWSMNRRFTAPLVSTRSMSTSGAGVYNVFWDGVDDEGNLVRAGTYILHVETSRERGKHTYRSLTLDFGNATRFVNQLAPTEEGGALRVSFDHY